MLINSNEFIAIDIYSEMVLDKYTYVRNLKMHNNWYRRDASRGVFSNNEGRKFAPCPTVVSGLGSHFIASH